MNVIGLGKAGCNIAEKLSQYPQYEAYYIDSVARPGSSLKVPKKKSHEEYEAKTRLRANFFKQIKGECLFIVCGCETISGLTLRILEKFSGEKIEILYIKPDISLLPEIKILQERVTFNILQQYTRSGVFEKMYIVENAKLESTLGDVQIIGYYDKLNELLVSTLHMINVYKHSIAEMDTFSSSEAPVRISTFGVVECDSGEEKLFYDIDFPREKVYYYAINQEQLEKDGSLFKKIKQQVKKQAEEEKLKVSYGVFSTDYEQNYAYCITSASFIQEQKI